MSGSRPNTPAKRCTGKLARVLAGNSGGSFGERLKGRNLYEESRVVKSASPGWCAIGSITYTSSIVRRELDLKARPTILLHAGG